MARRTISIAGGHATPGCRQNTHFGHFFCSATASSRLKRNVDAVYMHAWHGYAGSMEQLDTLAT